MGATAPVALECKIGAGTGTAGGVRVATWVTGVGDGSPATFTAAIGRGCVARSMGQTAIAPAPRPATRAAIVPPTTTEVALNCIIWVSRRLKV